MEDEFKAYVFDLETRIIELEDALLKQSKLCKTLTYALSQTQTNVIMLNNVVYGEEDEEIDTDKINLLIKIESEYE